MDNTVVLKHTISFGLSLAVCAVLNALLVIAKEERKGVVDGMQKITGHQWITHVAIVLILFGLFGWLFGGMNNGQGPKMAVNRLTMTILAGVVAGVVTIVGFYLIAD